MVDTPPSGRRALYPKSDGWYDKDSSGVETKLGGGGAGAWLPEKPPASPTTQDDEFSDGSLDVKWTEFDPNTKLAVTEETFGLQFVKTANGGTYERAGLYQSIPSGDFTIITRAMALGNANTYHYYGLALWEDAADTSKKMFCCDYYRNGAAVVPAMFAYEWTDYNSISTNKLAATTLLFPTNSPYMRLRRNGTNYYLEYSPTGYAWQSPNAYAAITLSFTPTHFGLFCDAYTNTNPVTFMFPFFRYLGYNAGEASTTLGNR